MRGVREEVLLGSAGSASAANAPAPPSAPLGEFSAAPIASARVAWSGARRSRGRRTRTRITTSSNVVMRVVWVTAAGVAIRPSSSSSSSSAATVSPAAAPLFAPDGGVQQFDGRPRRPEGHVLAAQLVQHVVRDGRGGGGWRSFKPLRRELVVRVQPRFVVHPVDAPARLGVQFFKDRRGDARGFVPRADRVERAAQRAARVARTEPTKQRR